MTWLGGRQTKPIEGYDGFTGEVSSKYFFSMKKDKDFFPKYHEQQVATYEKSKERPRLGHVTVSGRDIEFTESIDHDGLSKRILVSKDRKVIIKEYSEDKRDALLREVLQTEYFQKNGLPVIPILDVDLQNNRITKPFVLGAHPDQQQLYGYGKNQEFFEIHPTTLGDFTRAHEKLSLAAADLLLTKDYKDFVRRRLEEMGLPSPSESDLKRYTFSDLGRDGLSNRRANYMMRLTSEGFQLLISDP